MSSTSPPGDDTDLKVLGELRGGSAGSWRNQRGELTTIGLSAILYPILSQRPWR
jgi:hypothetical protein